MSDPRDPRATDHLVGDPTRPALHGGSVATLIDTASGFAAMTCLHSRSGRVSTADFRVDYLAAAPLTDIVCHAHVTRVGRRLIWVDATARAADGNDTVVAIGRGTFNVYYPKGAADWGTDESLRQAKQQ